MIKEGKMFENISVLESKPYLIALNEINTPEYSKSNFSKTELKDIKSIHEALRVWKFNFSLPIACLSEDKNKYELLTGLPIYQASIDAGIQRIWVFLIGGKRSEAKQVIEQFALQSKLNEKFIDITKDDFDKFLLFINNKSSVLTEISGIGDTFAKRITDNRPFNTIEQFQNAYGKNRTMKWIKAFKEKKAVVKG